MVQHSRYLNLRTWYDLKARKVKTNLKSYSLHVHLQFTTYRTYDELNFCFAFLQ